VYGTFGFLGSIAIVFEQEGYMINVAEKKNKYIKVIIILIAISVFN
jgi:hypothetical protein